MFDRFLLNQRGWIVGLALIGFAVHGVSQANQVTPTWLHGLMLLMGLGFTIYNTLFITNWHHLSERLIRKIQRWRSMGFLPSMSRKKIWYQQKLLSFLGVLIGLFMSCIALLGLILQTQT